MRCVPSFARHTPATTHVLPLKGQPEQVAGDAFGLPSLCPSFVFLWQRFLSSTYGQAGTVAGPSVHEGTCYFVSSPLAPKVPKKNVDWWG